MPITIDATAILDARSSDAAAGSVWSLEDMATTHEGDGGKIDVNQIWPRRRRKWTVSWLFTSSDAVETLYEALGTTTGFLFISPRDRDRLVTLGSLSPLTGDGSRVTFQLVVRVTAGATTVTRNIKYPISGTVSVYLNDVLQTTGFSVNYTTGIVTFDAPPANGVTVRATFQYAWPAHFTSPEIAVNVDTSEVAQINSLVFEEIFT